MLTFLINNAGTIVTALVLAAVVFSWYGAWLVTEKRAGADAVAAAERVGTCGGDCAVPPVKGTTRNR